MERVDRGGPVSIRFAVPDDFAQINHLRKQVNDLHVAGKPEIFKEGFPEELRDYLYSIFSDPRKKIVVCQLDEKLCAFAVLHHISRPETPYMRQRDYLDIDEFGVDEACQRQGVGTAMIAFIRRYAAEKGIRRIELNMWEFNQKALAFYEELGFTTFRRYMEMFV